MLGELKPPRLLADNEGLTPVDVAARSANLSGLPIEILAKAIVAPNKNGATPLHRAAMEGNLNNIPKQLLTVENLLEKDKFGMSVLLHAVPDPSRLSPFEGCKRKNLDALLGIDLPESTKPMLGNKWWQENEAVKASLKISNYKPTNDAELDIF